jgi:hypothetical protein
MNLTAKQGAVLVIVIAVGIVVGGMINAYLAKRKAIQAAPAPAAE